MLSLDSRTNQVPAKKQKDRRRGLFKRVNESPVSIPTTDVTRPDPEAFENLLVESPRREQSLVRSGNSTSSQQNLEQRSTKSLDDHEVAQPTHDEKCGPRIDEQNRKLSEMDKKLSDTTKKLAEANENLLQKDKTHKAKIEDLLKQQRALQARIDHRSDVLENRHARDLALLRCEYQNDIEERDAQLKALQQVHEDQVLELKTLQQDYDVQISKHVMQMFKLKENHASEKEWIVKKHDEELKSLDARRRQEELEWKNETSYLKDKHNAEMENLVISNQAELMEMEKWRKKCEQGWRNDFESLRVATKSEKDKMQDFFDKEVRRLRERIEHHEKDLWNQNRNSASPSSLFDEEDFKGKSDEEIGMQFGKVRYLVEDLARRQWKQEQKIWTDEVLQSLNPNNLRLKKKNILQNNIWTMLMYHIFSSPFRMFGEQGKILETEWSEHYGQGM